MRMGIVVRIKSHKKTMKVIYLNTGYHFTADCEPTTESQTRVPLNKSIQLGDRIKVSSGLNSTLNIDIVNDLGEVIHSADRLPCPPDALSIKIRI